MADWTYDPEIAGAVLAARQIKIATAREAAERAHNEPIGDRLWNSIEAKWEWHFRMSDEELRTGGRSRSRAEP